MKAPDDSFTHRISQVLWETRKYFCRIIIGCPSNVDILLVNKSTKVPLIKFKFF